MVIGWIILPIAFIIWIVYTIHDQSGHNEMPAMEKEDFDEYILKSIFAESKAEQRQIDNEYKRKYKGNE